MRRTLEAPLPRLTPPVDSFNQSSSLVSEQGDQIVIAYEKLLHLSLQFGSHSLLSHLPEPLGRNIADYLKRSVGFAHGILVWCNRDMPDLGRAEGMRLCRGACACATDRLIISLSRVNGTGADSHVSATAEDLLRCYLNSADQFLKLVGTPSISAHGRPSFDLEAVSAKLDELVGYASRFAEL